MVATSSQTGCPSDSVWHRCESHYSRVNRPGGNKPCTTKVSVPWFLHSELQGTGAGDEQHTLKRIWDRVREDVKKRATMTLPDGSRAINMTSRWGPGVWNPSEEGHKEQKLHWVQFYGDYSQLTPFGIYTSGVKGSELTERYNDSSKGVIIRPVHAVVWSVLQDSIQMSATAISDSDTGAPHGNASLLTSPPGWNPIWHGEMRQAATREVETAVDNSLGNTMDVEQTFEDFMREIEESMNGAAGV